MLKPYVYQLAGVFIWGMFCGALIDDGVIRSGAILLGAVVIYVIRLAVESNKEVKNNG